MRLPDGATVTGATVGFFEPAMAARQGPGSVLGAPSSPASDQPIATTDVQGRYAIAIPSGRYEVWVGGEAYSGFMPQQVAIVTVRSPRTVLDLSYDAHRVSGRMVGPGGTTVAYGRVFVQGSMNGTVSQIQNGRFSFLLPSDTYQFFAKPDVANLGVPEVTYPDIAVHRDTIMDLSVDGHAVSGVVTGPGGVPLVVAGVFARNLTVSAYSATGSQGEYRVYLPTGDYNFMVIPNPTLDTLGTRDFGSIRIDAPRTLDFDLSGPPPPVTPAFVP